MVYKPKEIDLFGHVSMFVCKIWNDLISLIKKYFREATNNFNDCNTSYKSTLLALLKATLFIDGKLPLLRY